MGSDLETILTRQPDAPRLWLSNELVKGFVCHHRVWTTVKLSDVRVQPLISRLMEG